MSIFELLDTQTQNGNLIDTQTDGHKIDTELDNIEVSGWPYQIKTHITHIVYQPFSRVKPPNCIALGVIVRPGSVFLDPFTYTIWKFLDLHILSALLNSMF